MIYTVTFSPSLDYVMQVKDFQPGRVNRSEGEFFRVGGKGVNVSIVLKNLGLETVALGFVAGFTGDEIERRLAARGVRADFVRASGLSRINVKLKADRETEINGQGGDISEENIAALTEKLLAIEDGSVLVLAGSVPKSIPQDIYERIMKKLSDKKIRIAVDATKDLLLKVIPYRPFVVKPNNHELGELFGVTLTNLDDIAFYAKKLREAGAENVIVSMAGDGALFAASDGNIYVTEAPKGKVVDSVGAGDSLVAGFLAGCRRGMSLFDAFRFGVATGSATAFSSDLATEDEVNSVLTSF